MGAPAASQSNSKTSPQFERNMKLMRALGLQSLDHAKGSLDRELCAD
jgi:hypothetical protein